MFNIVKVLEMYIYSTPQVRNFHGVRDIVLVCFCHSKMRNCQVRSVFCFVDRGVILS